MEKYTKPKWESLFKKKKKKKTLERNTHKLHLTTFVRGLNNRIISSRYNKYSLSKIVYCI